MSRKCQFNSKSKKRRFSLEDDFFNDDAINFSFKVFNENDDEITFFQQCFI